MKIQIRPETKKDIAKIRNVNAAAFDTKPDYYPRFGFVPASGFGINSEYDVPDEIFLVKELEKGALSEYRGVITYHPIFAQFD